MSGTADLTDEELRREVNKRHLAGRCPTCRKKWPLYLGAWDRHGRAWRCRGCLKIPQECTCR